MSTGMVVLVAAAVVFAFAAILWAVFTARRLDRLHIRLDRARYALEAAMDRRMAVTAALAPELRAHAAAAEALALEPGRFGQRADAEGVVSKHVRDNPGLAAKPELGEADRRVLLALRFYNDAVADTRSVRLKPGVRFLRLAGTAPMPQFFSLADVELSNFSDRESPRG